MSKLDDKVIKGLRDIGYNGALVDKFQLLAAVDEGQKSVEYSKLVNFLTNEIRILLSIDEEVNAISAPEDAVAFVMEITSFLKELNCPYESLTHGLVSERLQNVSDRLLLLDYLITELMGARILQETKPEKKIELKLQETAEGADMRQILQTLRFPKPPANITLKQLFDKLDTTVDIVLKKAGPNIVGNGLFNGLLSQAQWQILNDVQNDLNREYRIRREMMLTRLDVTIQSFQWSDKTKGKDDLFENVYHDKRKLLKVDPEVEIADLLAARDDLAIIEKISTSSVRKNTRSALNKVIIGQVPDRGGRSWEQAPPPPEMPSWQQRTPGPAPSARGGGNQQNFNAGRGGANRGGGGGRNQNNHQQNYESYSGRGYDNNRGYDNRDNRSFRGGYEGYRGGYDRRDSGGSYQQSKRAKTYDSFQANKTTYADQYVQEGQHNQQYHHRNDFGGRGRSNYRRGGGGGYR